MEQREQTIIVYDVLGTPRIIPIKALIEALNKRQPEIYEHINPVHDAPTLE